MLYVARTILSSSIVNAVSEILLIISSSPSLYSLLFSKYASLIKPIILRKENPLFDLYLYLCEPIIMVISLFFVIFLDHSLPPWVNDIENPSLHKFAQPFN